MSVANSSSSAPALASESQGRQKSVLFPGGYRVSEQLWRPPHVSLYGQGAKIGEGTYGHVFVGMSPDGKRVALKRIRKVKQEGFPITAIREIKILKALNAAATPDNPHPGKHNVVLLHDVVSSHNHDAVSRSDIAEGYVFMVFEFCDHDLRGLMESQVQMRPGQVKYYMREILQGLDFCHKNGILHRDIKGANILVSNNGDVRLADFGLARQTYDAQYTNRVVTLWYRAPELLLGEDRYDFKIDLWSTGCMFAELLNGGQVLFRGVNSEVDQLTKIFDKCGTPNEENWPGCKELRLFEHFRPKQHRARRLRELFRGHDELAVDLLDQLLALCPAKRLSAADALAHPYFSDPNNPVMRQADHPDYSGNFHVMEFKKKPAKPAGGPQQPAAAAAGGAGPRSSAAGASVIVGKKRPASTINYGFGEELMLGLDSPLVATAPAAAAPPPPPPPPPPPLPHQQHQQPKLQPLPQHQLQPQQQLPGPSQAPHPQQFAGYPPAAVGYHQQPPPGSDFKRQRMFDPTAGGRGSSAYARQPPPPPPPPPMIGGAAPPPPPPPPPPMRPPGHGMLPSQQPMQPSPFVRGNGPLPPRR